MKNLLFALSLLFCLVVAAQDSLTFSIDQLNEEYADKVQVFKIDLDQNKENAKKYEIRSIPAVLVFKDGELVERIIGKADYDTFSQAVEKHL